MEPQLEKIGGIALVVLPIKVLDASNSRQSKEALLSIIRDNSKVVFDLSRLHFVDSSGLGVMLSCLQQLECSLCT